LHLIKTAECRAKEIIFKLKYNQKKLRDFQVYKKLSNVYTP